MQPEQLLKESGRRLVVLCGGRSSESAVSLVSGRAVASALAGLGLPVQCFELGENRLPAGLDFRNDLVLPVVHGTYGEDGRLSADLERGGFAYAGCDQAASVLCFDKLASKTLAAELGLPVARGCLLIPEEETSHKALSELLGTPYILKPRRDGSSVGLHLVRSGSDFEQARADLTRTDYLAEAYLEGHDLTVGLLGGVAQGVVAVHPDGGLYDYQHKYTQGLSSYEVPALIPEAVARQLRLWSEFIFRGLGCRDLARADFRIGRKGEIIFLEINTLPGMTPTSLLPKSCSVMGLSFPQLVARWAFFALGREGALR